MPPAPPAPAPEEPQMPSEPPMEDPMAGGESDNPKVQELINKVSQLSDKGIDTVLAYTDSIADSVANNNSNEEQPDMVPPMQESFILTKRQIKEAQESCRLANGEIENNKTIPHGDKKKVKQIEFSAPHFN